MNTSLCTFNNRLHCEAPNWLFLWRYWCQRSETWLCPSIAWISHQANYWCTLFRNLDPADAFWVKQPVDATTFVKWVWNWDSALPSALSNCPEQKEKLTVSSESMQNWLDEVLKTWEQTITAFLGRCYKLGSLTMCCIHSVFLAGKKKNHNRMKKNGNCIVSPEH